LPFCKLKFYMYVLIHHLLLLWLFNDHTSLVLLFVQVSWLISTCGGW